MNRKGFLLASETLKIIIAVICIGFLVYFLVHLYMTNVGARELGEAEASLKEGNGALLVIIEGLGSGDVREDYLIPNPAGWWLIGFVGDEVKPNLCAGGNCLCLCKKKLDRDLPWNKNRQAATCDKTGVCGVVENLGNLEKIQIGKSGTHVDIRNDGGIININES